MSPTQVGILIKALGSGDTPEARQPCVSSCREEVPTLEGQRAPTQD